MRSVVLLAATITLAACGGSSASDPGAKPPSAAPADAPEADEAEEAEEAEEATSEKKARNSKLAHYSNGNGTLGFVLDRTGPTPKIKFDGSDEVIELKEVDGPTKGSIALHDSKDRELVVIDKWGGVIAAESGKLESVYPDDDAKPLP